MWYPNLLKYTVQWDKAYRLSRVRFKVYYSTLSVMQSYDKCQPANIFQLDSITVFCAGRDRRGHVAQWTRLSVLVLWTGGSMKRSGWTTTPLVLWKECLLAGPGNWLQLQHFGTKWPIRQVSSVQNITEIRYRQRLRLDLADGRGRERQERRYREWVREWEKGWGSGKKGSQPSSAPICPHPDKILDLSVVV